MSLLRLITYIFTNISLVLIALFVYLNNRKSISNRVFSLFLVSIAVWISSLAFADTSTSMPIVLAASKGAFASAALIFFLLVWLALVFPYENKNFGKKKLVAVFMPVVLFVILAPTNLAVQSVAIKDYGADVVSGPLYDLFSVYAVLCLLLCIYLLIKSYNKAKGNAKIQLRLLIYGLGISAGIGIFTNVILVLFGISSLGFLGAPGVLVLAAATAYAIVKHKLFDIRLIVARSVTYLLSIVTIGVTYGLLTFSLVDQLLFGASSGASVTQNTVNTMLAVILAFTFQPIKGFFEKVTDKIFYRDKYDPQILIDSIGKILASEIELESLTTKVVHELKRQMRLEHGDIIVLEDNQEAIFFDAGHMNQRTRLHRRDLVKLGTSIVVADELSTGERKEIMANYNMSVASALRSNKQLIGYLFLGNKSNGDSYTSGDIEVIKIIVNELAVAVQNAKAYTEIQRFNETLQDKVTEATRKLRKANEDLKSLDKAKDEFISMASHQLRTPLTTAKGYVSMVLDGDFGKIPSKVQPPLAQALDSTNRMSGLINDLLNVSRMDAGKFFIDATDVDLDVEVRGEINQLANLSRAKSVTLTYHPPKKKIPLIKLDLDKTRQVIMNIADNAVHYSAPPNGGGKADVYLELEGDQAVFKVVDNGIGVPDDIKPKLFAKFYRAGNAQSARPDGTGLGLYLVKRVVEDQGGSIIFESQVGKGSTFGFRMPIHNKLKIDKEAAKRLQGSSN